MSEPRANDVPVRAVLWSEKFPQRAKTLHPEEEASVGEVPWEPCVQVHFYALQLAWMLLARV